MDACMMRGSRAPRICPNMAEERVAFGAPKQEMWIDRVARAAGVPVAMGVGGSFDYLTGRVPRAPAWMRRARLEWLFRLGRQPWRLKRMAVLPRYAIGVLAQGRQGSAP